LVSQVHQRTASTPLRRKISKRDPHTGESERLIWPPSLQRLPAVPDPKPSEKCDEQLLEQVAIATHAQLSARRTFRLNPSTFPTVDHVQSFTSRPARPILLHIPPLRRLATSPKVPPIRFIPSGCLAARASRVRIRNLLGGNLTVLQARFTARRSQSHLSAVAQLASISHLSRKPNRHFTSQHSTRQHPANTVSPHS
jgi:hypothetical protein